MEKLKPIIDREVYSKLTQQKLEYELYTRVFKPILDIFGLSYKEIKPELKNAKARESLTNALISGSITFYDGWFKGKFTAAISKELWNLGAQFYPKTKQWKIEQSKLPVSILLTISRKNEEIHAKVEQALHHLDKIEKKEFEPIEFSTIADGILGDLDKQFDVTTAKKYEIPYAMSGYIDNELKTNYTENLNLYIKGWQDESIIRLRGEIQQNALQGYRAEGMRQSIINEYGVTANKAKFLAKQETSLLVSGYREANYKEAGVNFYQWSTSHDQRVRQSHKDLNGRIFSWNDPPIVDPATGKRAHPGEDFGCRCVAIPILQNQMERITEMAKQGKVFKGDITNV